MDDKKLRLTTDDTIGHQRLLMGKFRLVEYSQSILVTNAGGQSELLDYGLS
jgi:hypothetical protein